MSTYNKLIKPKSAFSLESLNKTIFSCENCLLNIISRAVINKKILQL